MKVSLIIAVYKDIVALKLILDSLVYQTYKNFEAVIVEDGNSHEMHDFITKAQKLYDFDIKHTSQEDKGVRKARSQNNGILVSSGEYIIFIDGDCILFSTFIEAHVKLAKKNQVLSGRRLNLDKTTSQKLRDGKIIPKEIENRLFTKYLYLAFDRESRFEQGIYVKPHSFIYNILKKRERNNEILGCNFSAWKDDLIRLNGFDEINYGSSAIPDDMDWTWRFKAANIDIVSCKNSANMMHLWHKIHDRGDATPYLKKMQENMKNGKYICDGGLNLH